MSHRPARINPDRLAVLVVASVMTGLLAVTSFMLSFAGLVAVAAWASVPSWLSWAVPVTIDLAILVYTLAALVARARGESAARAWCSLALWTFVSVTANGLHAWTDAPALVQTIAGMTIAGLAPIAVLLATHTLADLIIAKPEHDAPAVPTPHPLAVLRDVEVQHVTATAHASLAARRAAARETRRPRPITDAQRATIRELRAQGMTVRAIAAEVGVSKTAVSTVTAKQPAPTFKLLQEVHTA
ncbi:DUF2637 domain-containing protein [Oerskovia sp. NPDC060338]|uniref:DUF2637 domain-containing protein n=1 Tax=Oerskovia sp. NPDC060338 TaxID=3347100 RepID=UPI00364FD505